jgi:hypothetical protein
VAKSRDDDDSADTFPTVTTLLARKECQESNGSSMIS